MRHCLWAGMTCLLFSVALGAQSSSQPIRTLAEALSQRDAVASAASARVSAQRVEAAAPAASPAVTVQEELRTLTAEAAVIFAGEVVSVRRGEGVVEIRWKVEDAVRGVAGAEYLQREWSGLWNDGDRYAVGQRSLVMLHAPSVAGFSSPVRGMDGVMPLNGDAFSGTVDLRWVMTHVRRADAAGSGGVTAVRTMATLMQRSDPGAAGVAGNALSARDASSANRVAAQEVVTTGAADAGDAVRDAAQGVAERSTVMSLMRAWTTQGVQQ